MLSIRHPAAADVVTIRPRVREARQDSPGAGREIAFSVIALALVAIPLPYLLRSDHGHYITALLLTLTLAACSFYSRRGAMAATLVLLAVLGDYRRYAGYYQGYPGIDPLLLVAPVVAMLLLMQGLLRGRRAPWTWLSGLVLALMGLMVVEMFNPAQGDIQVGIGGALFYLVPLTWFWVARVFATREFARDFVGMIIVVGVAAMLLGLYQTWCGLLPFEQHWVDQGGYQSLYVSEDVVRAFGFFNSSAEYERYLIVTAVAVFALWVVRRSSVVVLLPLLLVTIFLSAARGPVVLVLAAIAVVWAISAPRAGTWLPRLALATALGAAALIAALLLLQGTAFQGRVAPLVDRQVEGLLDPANEEKSTATGHAQMLRDGLFAGFTSPAGLGLGATTEAAHKYGLRNLSSEVDLSNLMISVGLLGGLLYLAIVVTVLTRAIGWWRRDRSAHALAIAGSLFGTLSAWLIGGEYSIAALVWFQIGLLDRLALLPRPSHEESRACASR